MNDLLTAVADAACTCPSCGTVLRVNLSASGKRARCRCCGNPFTIPSRRALIEDTASFLIHRDVAQEMAARDQLSEKRVADAA